MRLHHLTVTAFGPFAGTERVDFEDLNDAGLFLLTGPTGAGKTSILDAVCFALYGSVPGVRGVKTLKSQHADVDTAPEVVLDFSVRERRFVVRRSPEWLRPKRKGSGLVTEKAAATLVETTSGEDHFLSSRAQEVGHLVGELMGMTASQFVQVAMLPQGEFQRFLRAGSDERHAVLQHLFKTDRFSRIEEWVNDHSRGLRGQSAHGQSAVQRILDTMADRAAMGLPEDLCEERLLVTAADGRALSWADEAVAEAEARLAAATARHDRAGAAVATARRAHDDGQQLAALLARRDRALATLAGLAADEDAVTAAREALEADGRAAPCLPVLRLLDAAAAQQSAAASRHAEALDAAVTELGSEGLSDAAAGRLDELLQQLRARTTRAEALLPREQESRDARAELREAEAAAETARAEQSRVEQRRAALPDELAALRERLVSATAAAGRREALLLALESACAVHHAAEQVPALEREVVRLQDLARDARDRLAEARELVQQLADRRLAGIAAELAGRLTDGHPCQVCGSVDHPVPAQPQAGAVTEAEQEDAAARYDAGTEDYAQAARAVAEAERTLAGAREAAQGLDAAATGAKVAGVRAAVAEAERAAEESVELEQRAATLTEEQARLADRAATLGTTLATLEQTVADHRRSIARIAAEILDVTGEVGGSLAELVDRSTRACRRLAALTSAVQALESARARVEELTGEATGTAADHGFADLAVARAAVLPGPERERLETLLAERTRTAAEARAVLDDPEVRAVDGRPLPDVAVLAEALQAAEQDDAAAAREHHQADEQVGALRHARDRLHAALEEWTPVRERCARAESMAKLVRGMGHDNQLQMRLSAYVLATRLDQVVAAANERLAQMRDQRYLLQRTGRAHRKGSQAGLGLEVVDQWTGDVRDPATLSGGETFVVSLSLALGLADVVTQEAGGTEIDTLFVDEGFGTLDPDTLDDVMDRLDGLRAGGRTVGVVSHVSELRNRIPMQLHVDKHRSGSTVAVRTLAG